MVNICKIVFILVCSHLLSEASLHATSEMFTGVVYLYITIFRCSSLVKVPPVRPEEDGDLEQFVLKCS